MGQARSILTIHPYPLDPLQNICLELVPEMSQSFRLCSHLRGHKLRCLLEPNDGWDVLGPGSPTPLLPPSPQQRLESNPSSEVQSPHPLRAIDLVGGEGKEVDVEMPDIDGDLAKRLDRIGVEEDSALSQDGSHFAQGKEDPCLVVGVHQRDQDSVRLDGPAEFLWV